MELLELKASENGLIWNSRGVSRHKNSRQFRSGEDHY